MDLGVLTQGGQEVAQAAFRRVDAVMKAEALSIVGIARLVQVAQGLGASPAVGDLPAVQEEEGDGVEGAPASARGPAQALGQDRTQPGEVDQAQDQVKVGQELPGRRVEQILVAEVAIVRAEGRLGQGGTSGGVGQRKGSRACNPARLQGWTKAASCARVCGALHSAAIAPSSSAQNALHVGLGCLKIAQGMASQKQTHRLRVGRMTQPSQCLVVQLTHPLFGQSQAHADVREDGRWLSVQPIASDDDRAQAAWQPSHHGLHRTHSSWTSHSPKDAATAR